MVEFLIGIFTLVVLTVVINKTTEDRFDAIKAHLREVWWVLGFLYITYWIFRPESEQYFMALRYGFGAQYPLGSYALAACAGALLFTSYWWLLGKALPVKADGNGQQQGEPKKPDVQQQSNGANSPNTNITGDGNTVTNTVIINSKPPSPSFQEKTDAEMFYFSFGEHGMISGQPISWIRKHTYRPFLFGDFAPVTVTIKGVKLLFDFQVWGGEGKPPIEVRDNNFTVRVPMGWDRNSSANALEVVNANGTPVFQMIRKSATNIVVNGAFPTPSGIMLAGSGPTITGARSEDLRNFHLKPLFKYPSWKYPGQYAD